MHHVVLCQAISLDTGSCNNLYNYCVFIFKANAAVLGVLSEVAVYIFKYLHICTVELRNLGSTFYCNKGFKKYNLWLQ